MRARLRGGGGGWGGCLEFCARAGAIREAVKFTQEQQQQGQEEEQQQQQPLSAAALERNFFCHWSQVLQPR